MLRSRIGHAFCCAVDTSQLYRAPWMDAIPRTLPGALVLGYGVLWSDLACYVAGVGVGAGGELLLRGRQRSGLRGRSRPEAGREKR